MDWSTVPTTRHSGPGEGLTGSKPKTHEDEMGRDGPRSHLMTSSSVSRAALCSPISEGEKLNQNLDNEGKRVSWRKLEFPHNDPMFGKDKEFALMLLPWRKSEVCARAWRPGRLSLCDGAGCHGHGKKNSLLERRGQPALCFHFSKWLRFKERFCSVMTWNNKKWILIQFKELSTPEKGNVWTYVSKSSHNFFYFRKYHFRKTHSFGCHWVHSVLWLWRTASFTTTVWWPHSFTRQQILLLTTHMNVIGLKLYLIYKKYFTRNKTCV